MPQVKLFFKLSKTRGIVFLVLGLILIVIPAIGSHSGPFLEFDIFYRLPGGSVLLRPLAVTVWIFMFSGVPLFYLAEAIDSSVFSFDCAMMACLAGNIFALIIWIVFDLLVLYFVICFFVWLFNSLKFLIKNK